MFNLTMAPTPGTQLNLSFVSTASRDRLRRVTTSRNSVAVSRAELLDLFFLAFFWSSWFGRTYRSLLGAHPFESLVLTTYASDYVPVA